MSPIAGLKDTWLFCDYHIVFLLYLINFHASENWLQKLGKIYSPRVDNLALWDVLPLQWMSHVGCKWGALLPLVLLRNLLNAWDFLPDLGSERVCPNPPPLTDRDLTRQKRSHTQVLWYKDQFQAQVSIFLSKKLPSGASTDATWQCLSYTILLPVADMVLLRLRVFCTSVLQCVWCHRSGASDFLICKSQGTGVVGSHYCSPPDVLSVRE